MKKLLTLVALLLCTVMVMATEKFNGNGQGTASSPYEIWNVDRLNEVRNFDGESGVYFRLEVDIDLTDYLEGINWDPIGSDGAPFGGVFLGNGHTISGMVINGSDNYQGFFGCVSGATIKNLTVVGSVKGGQYVGGIVGKGTGTTLTYCSFTGGVEGSGNYVGGIAGSFSGTIKNATHSESVKGKGYVGGIVGYLSGSLNTVSSTGNVSASGTYAGGLVGYCLGDIISSSNKGNVHSTDATVGGLAGYLSGNSSNSSSEGAVWGKGSYVGGVAGTAYNSTLTNVYSKGEITSSGSYTGGLVGKAISPTINRSSHKEGNVSGQSRVGGVIGVATGNVAITTTYVYCNITGTNNVGGIVGLVENSSNMQITSSGFFGNITASSYVGGVLGANLHTAPSGASSNYTLPTLHTYKTYGSTSSEDMTYQETLTESSITFIINNCVAVGNIIASGSYVGGVLGQGYGNSYLVTTTSNPIQATRYNNQHTAQDYGRVDCIWYDSEDNKHWYSNGDVYSYFYYYKDGVVNSKLLKYICTAHDYGKTDRSGNLVDHRGDIQTFTYNTYTTYQSRTTLTDNYFSGNLKGTDYVGGVVGYMTGGDINRNYSYAAIEGNSNVGGIVGYMKADLSNQSNATITSNVQLNSTISAVSNAGKIYGGTTGNNLSISTSGSSEINKSLNTTNLIVNGVTTTTDNSAQHGKPQTQRQLTQTTSYAGLGWNFDTGAEWTAEESVSYPYKQYQTAPPTIQNGAYKGSTTLNGTCIDNGTVYVTLEGNNTVFKATCSGGNWTLAVPALRSGILIRAWSKSPNKEQSYHTSTIVSVPGSGTEADPWQILDAYDLMGVAKAGYYKLMNDVDLTSWISANSATEGWPGVGSTNTGIHFDGNGYTVSGLWSNTTASQKALFTYLEDATIKDLTVVVATGKKVKGGSNTAILASQLKGSMVTNVTVKGAVQGENYTAALIGKSENNTISQCIVSNCTINGSSTYVGGLLGYSKTDNISNCTVEATVTTYSSTTSACRGGLAGYMSQATVQDCTVEGTITTSEANANVGGLAGSLTSSRKMTNCSATIAITANGSANNVGGLVGQSSSNAITQCKAAATISSTTSNGYVGGIVGNDNGSTSISLCSVEGTVVATGSNTYAGGIIAKTTASSPVANCMSLVDVTGTAHIGGIVGYAFGSITNCFATGSLNNTSDAGRAGGIVGFIDGSAAIVMGCGGLNKRIETGSNQWGFRIIGGTGSDIQRPEITDNYGWDEMPILRNNARKTVYDDPYEGTAKTTEELQQQSTYETLGWDFNDVWMMDANHPKLQWLGSAVMKGDLNGDGTVSITDVVLIIDVIAGDITDANQVAAADVNNDGTVSITDCVAAIDLIAEQAAATSRMAKAAAHLAASDFITATMDEGNICVALDNEHSYAAFQMVVTMPEGMAVRKAVVDKMRSTGHQVVVRNLGNGQYLVAGFSMDNDVLTGNSGRLLTIVTDGSASGDIVISNVEFATADAEGYRLANAVVSSGTTGIQTADVQQQPAQVYDLQGRHVKTPAKGLYILNGKKINLK